MSFIICFLKAAADGVRVGWKIRELDIFDIIIDNNSLFPFLFLSPSISLSLSLSTHFPSICTETERGVSPAFFQGWILQSRTSWP